jgi:hypothetical protein
LQAFPAENLLCALEPLILLSFYYRVIKKGIGNPLCFGVENRGFFLVPKVIIYESLCDHRDEQRVALWAVGWICRSIQHPWLVAITS